MRIRIRCEELALLRLQTGEKKVSNISWVAIVMEMENDYWNFSAQKKTFRKMHELC